MYVLGICKVVLLDLSLGWSGNGGRGLRGVRVWWLVRFVMLRVLLGLVVRVDLRIVGLVVVSGGEGLGVRKWEFVM